MKCLLLIFFIGLSANLFAQDFDSIHILRVWENNPDAVVEKIKRDKNGIIKKLYQFYYEEGPDSSYYQITEEYIINKHWCLWREKEIVKKVKKNYTTLNYVLDGKQYQYDKNGRTIFIAEYRMGKLIEPTIGINYYPNGKIKYVAEGKEDQIWNILDYFYPNGETYEFGDFKNGKGSIIYLNDIGEPCISCNFSGNEINGRSLCENQGER